MILMLAAAISAVVVLVGWRLRALTPAGAMAAIAVGSAILWRTGWPGLAALGVFFVGASIISRLAPDHSRSRFDSKGNTRDAAQVLANGGAAALAALLLPLEPALWMVTAALATAAADTWATSVGGWSRSDPRFILSGKPVPAGTSGAVSFLGTAGGLLGGLTVAVSAGLIARHPPLIASCSVIGGLGMMLDSLLGATAQARFHCPACHQPTERARHRCGTNARLMGGVSWLNNDAVNAIATSGGALLGWLAWRLVAG